MNPAEEKLEKLAKIIKLAHDSTDQLIRLHKEHSKLQDDYKKLLQEHIDLLKTHNKCWDISTN